MSHLYITGASGLLGRRLTALMSERNCALTMPSRDQLDLGKPVPPGQIKRGTDAVIYLAQSRRFREFPEGAADMLQVNLSAPLSLLAQAAEVGAKSFIYASTGSIYQPSAEAITEESPLVVPMNFYPATKRSFERLSESFRDRIVIIILRFFFIYGPSQIGHMLLSRVAAQVRVGTPIRLPRNDSLRFNPIHVDDAARAIAAAVNLGRSEIINVAGPETASLGTIARLLGELSGQKPVFDHQLAEMIPLIADISRMSRLLGGPKIDLAKGLETIV